MCYITLLRILICAFFLTGENQSVLSGFHRVGPDELPFGAQPQPFPYFEEAGLAC